MPLTILTNLLPYVPGYTGFSSYVRRVMPGLPGLRLVLGSDDHAICRDDDWLPEEQPRSRRLAILHQLALTQHGVDSNAALRSARHEISDVQVVYSPYCDALLSWRDAPQVITCHDLTPLFYPNSRRAALRYRLWMPLHLKKASAVIAISRYVADQLVNFGVPAAKIEVIPNGIAIEREPIVAPASNDLILIARHDQNKNVLFVARAFSRVLALVPKWNGRLVIVGRPGRETSPLLQLINQLPHPEMIVLVHQLNRDELLHRLRGSLALVSASKMEGFDYPAVEAKAEGLPSLLSDIPVHREFHSDSSEFFDLDKNPDELAYKIIRLGKESEVWRQLSIAGTKMCKRLPLHGQQASILDFLNRF